MGIFILIALIILGMNIVPAFMPPTWVVLAFFYYQFHLPLIPTVIVGATSATTGRVILALLARRYLRPFIPKSLTKNYDAFGTYFRRHQHVTIPLIITYAFFPIPSNQVYIIAGISKMNLTVIALSFFAGRLISYSFWVTISYHFAHALSDIFAHYFSSRQTFVAEFIGFSVLIAVGMINWKSVFNKIRL